MMKTKNIVYLNLVFATYLFTNLTHAGLSDLIHADPWKFMQDKFVKAPQAQASTILPIVVKSLVASGIGLGSGIGSYFIHTKYLLTENDDGLLDSQSGITEFEQNLSLISKIAILPLSIILSYTVYYKLHARFISHYQRKQVIDLLENWQKLKTRVPSELREGFEEIYKEYKDYPKDFYYKTDDIIRVLVEQINEKFENKTPRGTFWNSKVLTGNIFFDIGNTLSSIMHFFK